MPNTITAERIRELLRSPDHDPRLVLLEGRALVVAGEDLGTDRYRGAVEVVSRSDLTARLGAQDPSDRDLETLAAPLEAVVTELGA